MKDFLKRIKLNEGNLSLGMGILVMVVAGALLFNYFRNIDTISTRDSRISSASTEILPTPSDSPRPTPTGTMARIPSPTSAVRLATPTPTIKKIASPTPTKAVPTTTVMTSPTPTASTLVTTRAPVTPSPTQTTTTGQREYVVKTGDSLWKIAQSAYNNGYDWTRIYEANKSAIGGDAGKLAVGMKLQLPEIAAATQSTATDYVVKSGDNLWNISTTVCGTGFAYSTIATANSIPNPRIIRPGLKLHIQCPQMR